MKMLKTSLLFASMLCIQINITFGQMPILGAAEGFSMFTGVGAFTITGASMVTGDVGVDAGTFTGFPPGTLNGQLHLANTVTAQVATDVGLLYADLDGRQCESVLDVGMGNGQTLTPGNYCLGAAGTLSGNLIFDALNNPDALFIIQVDAAFVVAENATVTLVNGASSCNVFWQINGMLTLSNNSQFKGTAVVGGAVSLLGTASVEGRVLVTNGAINMEVNDVLPCMLFLPVELTSFEVLRHKSDHAISLNWQTASELNSAYFVIEKSSDGNSFYQISKISAKGNSQVTVNYAFEDREPLEGMSYYRLTQYDLDGSFTYSDLRSIDYRFVTYDLNIFPNPFSDELNIQITSNNETSDLTFELYKLDGQKVSSINLSNEVTVLKNNNITPGHYFYVLKRANNMIERGLLFSF